MGMQHFFMGGDIAWIFPIMMIIMFVVIMAIRSLTGRGGFGSMDRGFRRRRGHFRRGMFLDEEEEKSSSYPFPSQDKVQVRPAIPPETEERLGRPTMQIHLDKARNYKEQIDNLIKSTSDQKARARLQDLAVQVNEWVKAIEDLAKRVQSFHQNTLILQDLESVPKSIEELEARLANESNETTRIELERTLANRKNQLAALKRLQDTINRAEIKTESTLSALGTIYSQILTAQSADQVADYSRLSAEVNEEVLILQDHLEALEEVKLRSV